MKILVTGGTCYIGNYTVVELLNNNYDVVIIDNLCNYKSDVIDKTKKKEINVCIYEPTIIENTFNGIEVIHDLELFKDISNVIIANRTSSDLDDCKDRVYTRDIFDRD